MSTDGLLRESIADERGVMGPHCRCQQLALELLDRAVTAEEALAAAVGALSQLPATAGGGSV